MSEAFFDLIEGQVDELLNDEITKDQLLKAVSDHVSYPCTVSQL